MIEEFYPSWLKVKEVSYTRYSKLYPNLSIDEINRARQQCYDCLVRNGSISADSKNYPQYERGWIANQDSRMGMKGIKIFNTLEKKQIEIEKSHNKNRRLTLALNRIQEELINVKTDRY